MYEWLNTDDHSVENFNKIFDLSRIDFPDKKAIVVIGDIDTGELREITVGKKKFKMQLRKNNFKKYLKDLL